MNESINGFRKPSAGNEETLPKHEGVPPNVIAPVAQELEKRAAKIEPGLSPEEAEDLNDTLRDLGL